MAHNLASIPTSFTGIHTRNRNSCCFRQLGFREKGHSATPKKPFGRPRSQATQNPLGELQKGQQLKVAVNSTFRELSSTICCRAVGSNTSEDTDDMFDDLFDKYGKVVYTRNDQKPPIAEVDDDAESLSFAMAMAKVADEMKAADIKLLFVKPLVYWTRFFIIATAFSRPQIGAIRSKMSDLAEEKFGRVPKGDFKPNSWTLLDFGDVVVHIFLPPQRTFYNLEEFYGNATSIELPFEGEKPFRQ